MEQAFKFRGCDRLYFGDVTEAYDEVTQKMKLTFGAPEKLAIVTEVGVTTASDSATHFGDNKPMLIINSEGADEITFSVFGIPADVLAKITGKYYDASKQMFVNRQRDFSYKYAMWRERLTNGRYRYRVAYKGMFNVPDTTVSTEDDGTEANGQDITFTSVMTETIFNDGKSSKGYFVEDGEKIIDAETFFTALKTQDEFTLPTE